MSRSATHASPTCDDFIDSPTPEYMTNESDTSGEDESEEDENEFGFSNKWYGNEDVNLVWKSRIGTAPYFEEADLVEDLIECAGEADLESSSEEEEVNKDCYELGFSSKWYGAESVVLWVSRIGKKPEYEKAPQEGSEDKENDDSATSSMEAEQTNELGFDCKWYESEGVSFWSSRIGTANENETTRSCLLLRPLLLLRLLLLRPLRPHHHFDHIARIFDFESAEAKD